MLSAAEIDAMPAPIKERVLAAIREKLGAATQ